MKFTKKIAAAASFAAVLLLVWRALGYPGLDYREDAPLPTGLHPVVREQATELIRIAADKGIRIQLVEDFRSFEAQNQLYAKGRTEPGSIVTYAQGGESYHNYGLAVDFALKSKNGNLIWDQKVDMNGNGKTDWEEVATIAKSLGFEWGGDWENFKDYPHLQMTFGLSIRDLQMGKRPPDSQ
ncbi:M15 family peptidase [Neobacillus notoginsengisoli]|uniref:M15 family peptidase n=1 Tax=Neobacillus notoginsengisoli TaxID=1578198 RepID=A0A417YRZ2_9BACI|nr:M15 family metallopeptidase [Neobacillus notoginsengisoli]RHW38062.1 M15 family peptidase [Neobacillus notoginsengisoli]